MVTDNECEEEHFARLRSFEGPFATPRSLGRSNFQEDTNVGRVLHRLSE